ncbi:hypothetical protein [Burkholderia dolosa]|uniref:hypothetical protein n=1 Tax=Burkholderia dolosa TaxID=152500 RepID=UPI001C95B3DC|nr:hypothetical protein [Burkholderia dolosa]MBY4828695.1 hypothetical protein [Burkholderia dolosa]
MTDALLLEILTTALHSKVPDAYRRMKADGTLDTFLSNLLATALEAISEARQSAIGTLVTQGNPQFEEHPLKRTQAINMAEKSAEEIALALAMETIEALSLESGKTAE